MAFDVARVRGLTSSLSDGWIRLDASAGMAIPDVVVNAMSTAFRSSLPGISHSHPNKWHSTDILDRARHAVADLVGADPCGVVFGSNPAVLLTTLANSAPSQLGIGSEIILTKLNDLANTTPWLLAAHRYGATVRWAEFDIETGGLPVSEWRRVVDPSTRLVTLPSVSPILGTAVHTRSLARFVHNINAHGLVIVDYSAAAPYQFCDINSLEADIVVINSAGWGGPPVGALVFRDPNCINSFSVASTDPHAVGPQRLELGSYPLGLLAGLVASVEYLSTLDDEACGTRRERLAISLDSAARYCEHLFEYLVQALDSLPRVRVLCPGEQHVPVLSFIVDRIPATQVAKRLADNHILTTCHVHSPVLEPIGVNDLGGAITIGLGHYSTMADVDQLIRTLASLG